MDYNEDYCGEHSDAEDDGFSTHLLRVSKEHSELSGANTDGIQGVAELRRYGHKKVRFSFAATDCFCWRDTEKFHCFLVSLIGRQFCEAIGILVKNFHLCGGSAVL